MSFQVISLGIIPNCARIPKIINNITLESILKFFFRIHSIEFSINSLIHRSTFSINLRAFLIHLSVISINDRPRTAIISHTNPFKIMSIIQPTTNQFNSIVIYYFSSIYSKLAMLMLFLSRIIKESPLTDIIACT